jgi:hypothetical protein
MPDKLPPAEVTVTTPEHQKINVNIKREGARERNYVGDGPNECDRTKDAFKKYLDDPASAEYIRRG